MQLVSYSVSIDARSIDDVFSTLSPYKLKNDIKGMSNDELDKLAQSIADELKNGPHGQIYVIRYSNKTLKKINYSKIRTTDEKRNKGKSGGYRCIVLVDGMNKLGYVLHLYRHSHGEDENICHADENKLRKLVDTYASDLAVAMNRR